MGIEKPQASAQINGDYINQRTYLTLAASLPRFYANITVDPQILHRYDTDLLHRYLVPQIEDSIEEIFGLIKAELEGALFEAAASEIAQLIARMR